jgi:hypothetical protein
VVCHPEQAIAITPGSYLAPGIGSHDKEKIGRLIQDRFEMGQRVYSVRAAWRIQLERRNQKTRVVLGSQRQHCVPVQCGSYFKTRLVRSDLGYDEPKFVNFKEPGNLSGYFQVSQMNRVKRAAVKSNPLFAVHWHNPQQTPIY